MVPRIYRIATALSQRLPLPPGKVAESLLGRHHAVEQWAAWASIQRTDGPLLWVHGASVGEGLTAAPVVTRLRRIQPDLQVIHTFSSPSAACWPHGFAANQTGYVPFDRPRDMSRVLETLNPSLLVFSRGDLWPHLVAHADRRGTPIAVLGGTVRPSSLRLRWPVRQLFAPVYDKVKWLGAATRGDADRWLRLGVNPNAVTVTGDPRHDLVLERISQIRPLRPLSQWSRNRHLLAAGSTHERDERVLTEAFSLIGRRPDATLVLVPHDPTERRVAEALSLAVSFGLRAEVWDGGTPADSANCIVVKRLGILADLFLIADTAYVGGGFTRGQLHSAAEPAAYALPIVIGPRHSNSADAAAMLKGGGAVVLDSRSPATQLAGIWQQWMDSPAEAISCGLRARGTLHQGAAEATARALDQLLRSSTQPA